MKVNNRRVVHRIPLASRFSRVFNRVSTSLGRFSSALPALCAALLSLPCFAFTYLWDDFDFLARAHPFRVESLIPDANTLFYRPVSRELYFGALGPFGMSGVLVGHLVNAALLAIAVLLTMALTRRLAGRREAVLAGCALAALGAAPILVGWISGAQDLLAGVFCLAALLLRLRGRTIPAVVALGLAIFSKETAVAFAPVVAALPWIAGSPTNRPWRGVVGVGALLLVWVWVHPGIRLLLHAGHSEAVGSEYVTLAAPRRTAFAARSALTLLNVPVTGAKTPWPAGRTAVALGAASLLALAALGSRSLPRSESREGTIRTLTLALLLVSGPFLVTVALVSRWSPYYSFLPAIGLAMAMGTGLARVPAAGAAAFLVAYSSLGVWARGLEVGDPTVTTERGLEMTSRALERVRKGFLALSPEMPDGAQLLVSVPGTGSLSVPVHLIRYSAPRVWYGKHGLIVREPRDRVPWSGPELLVRVTHALEVILIDTEALQIRHTGPVPDASDVDRPIRTYARALGTTGHPDAAIGMLARLARVDPPDAAEYDRRLAAMVLHQVGRRGEADQLMAGLVPYPHDVSVMTVAKLMTERAGPPDAVDSSAVYAFDLRLDDVELYRYLVQRALETRDRDLAVYAARRALSLVPEDSTASAALRRYENAPPSTRITAPIQ